MSNKKIILITGASGFLGTWLAEEAYNAGYNLIGIDLNIPLKPHLWLNFATTSCENVDWNDLVGNYQLHAVCHLAGGASVALSVDNPYSDFSTLIPGTAKLAIYVAHFQSQARFFLFSSAAVYGNPITLPIREDASILPISPYGIHKSIAESLLLNYARVFGLSLTIFRIFSVYGIGLRKQLIWDVANKAIVASTKKDKEILLFGSGNETRDFIYVNDICKAAILLVNQHSENDTQIYNMGSGIESSIFEIANSLIKHLNLNIKIKFDGNLPSGDPTNWCSNIERLSVVGFKPTYSLDEGLKLVAKWIQNGS